MTDLNRKTAPTVNSGGTVADKPEPVKAWSWFGIVDGSGKLCAVRGAETIATHYADELEASSAMTGSDAEYRVIPVRIVPEEE